MPESFATVLAELIDQRYETNVAYGAAVGLSRSRVSQLVSGAEASLSYRSLQGLLAGFELLGDKQRLYEAWRESYAKPPADEQLVGREASDETIANFVASAPQQMETGALRTVFRVSGQLWTTLRADPRRSPLAADAAQVRILSAYALDRRPEGVQLAQRLERLGRERGEPSIVATGLWLQALGLRTLPGGSLVEADVVYRRLEEYLGQWQPRSSEERAMHTDRSQALVRDRVLVAWGAHRQALSGASALLTERLIALRSGLKEADEPHVIGIGSEVQSRGLISLGRFDQAEDMLDTARSLPVTDYPIHEFKAALTRVRWFLAIGSLREATEALRPLLEQCEDQDFVHYRNEVARLQAELFCRKRR